MRKFLKIVVGAVGLAAIAFYLLGRFGGDDPAVADCAARGIAYFREIDSYPRLSDGRDAVAVAWERCRRTPLAFGR